MKKIMIDLETRSDADITKTGVYRYADSPFFDIMLFACSVDDEPVVVYDLASGDTLPDEIIDALVSSEVEKHAFNASFERVCLSVWLHRNYPDRISDDYLPPESWRCTMISSAYLGLPLSLSQVGEVLNIQQQKMSEGKALIRYFCIPDGKGAFHNPSDDPKKWEIFKKYNIRDVEAEREIERKISKFPVPDFVWDEYAMDQRINDRGILIDSKLVNSAIATDETVNSKLTARLQELTGLENPNSVTQLKHWFSQKGLDIDSLGKKDVHVLMGTVPDEIQEILKLRIQTSKSSVKKYTAMKNAVCSDGRARGMFQFYGANRTGRESGRIIQLQNLPQNHMSYLNEARELVKRKDIPALEMLYDDIPDTLSQLIRTAFIPRENCKFMVSDFNAIEARTIAWLAGEKWRMEAFERGEDIYCASASQMFGVPVEKHGVNGHLRQKGKVAELACGYSGSVGAMKAMGADALGLSDEELKKIVDNWRASSPNIVKLWYDVERAAVKAVKNKSTEETHGIIFSYESGFLFIRLPSGRRLAYVRPAIDTNRFNKECITYSGLGQSKKWERLETYSGKLVENIVQGIARDLLFYSMKSLSEYRIVAHIHDEVVIECCKDALLDDVCQVMSRTPEWAKGLKLQAAGYCCEYYMKD